MFFTLFLPAKKKYFFCILPLLVLLLIFSCRKAAHFQIDIDEEYRSHLDRYNRYAFNSYEKLRVGGNAENFFFSPWTSYFFLSSMYLFSNRDTQREIRSAIGLKSDDSNFEKYIRKMHSDIFYGEDVTTLFEYKIGFYPVTNFSLKDSYEKFIKDLGIEFQKDPLDPEVLSVPFNTVAFLNNQAQNITNRNISSIYQTTEVVGKVTRGYLYNVLNFTVPFERHKTLEGVKIDFYHLHQQKVTTDGFTYKEFPFSLWESEKFTVVKLTVAAPFSIYFFMERSIAGASTPLSYNLIQDFPQNARLESNKSITFPQIDFSQDILLKDHYQRLGITKAYSSFEANFSNLSIEKVYFLDTRISNKLIITPEGNIASYGVLAEVFAQVDQFGSVPKELYPSQIKPHKQHLVEMFQTTQDAQSEERLILDKPFHYVVYNDALGMVLYMGYYTNPFQKS